MAGGSKSSGDGGTRRSATAILSVRTLGKFALRVGERGVGPLGRKSTALIAYLALSESGTETRERLVGLLWSETDEGKARASLRQSLHEIREAFDKARFGGLHTDNIAVTLDRSQVDADLRDILDDAAAGRPHPLLLESERPIDRLLEDFESLDPAFRVWLLAKRQSLGERLTQSLETAMGDASKPASVREALARALMSLDPTHEEAARLLIRSRAKAGDIGGALRIYKTLWDLLDNDYDVEPSKTTQELIAKVKLGELGDISEPRGESQPRPDVGDTAKAITLPPGQGSDFSRWRQWPKLVISIANFEGSAVDPPHQHLLHGFRRELIACLVRFREWVVRDGLAGAGNVVHSVPEGAEYLIEANAAPAADNALRLVITLRDTGTHAYLWSERLSITLSTWFDAQQRVVRRITTALNVHLSAERLVSIAHRPPGDLKAFDLWLLGQATFLSFDLKKWELARRYFHEVIKQMPDFAPAYSSLAQLNNSEHIVKPGVFRDLKRSQESLAYAREAARLDPIDSRSQLCLGWSHAAVRQYEQAMIYIPLAYELNENDPWTLVSAAWGFAACGHHQDAKEIAEHALRLPLAPSPLQWSYHTAIRFMGADYEGCVQAAEEAGELSLSALGYKVAALQHLGRSKAARVELQHYFATVRSRWVGAAQPSDANIARWLLQMAPIKRSEDWQRLRDGIAGAGGPVEGLAHDLW